MGDVLDVGFVGLGQMGSAMTRNLVKAGHLVTVYNRTRAKAETLAAEGARVAERIADACQGEILITMLADDAAVEALLFGDPGIGQSLAPGAIHVAMSTVSVALSERLARTHREASQIYVAAPVFGRPEAAAAAKLFIVAGGPSQAIEKCQPLFEAMGQKTFVIGERPSDANLVKLSGNFLIAAIIETLGEAIALIRKSGIDAHRYVEILTGTLFSAPVYETYGAIIANEKYEPAGLKLALGFKDVRLAFAAAESLQVPMPIASLIRDRFISGLARGEGDSDWAALARLAARDSGL